MKVRNDSVYVSVWSVDDYDWGMQITHSQAVPSDGTRTREWTTDDYDFRGEGPVTDQAVAEVMTLVAELLGYSVERICGLQMALF
jgi:hypothetical protein